MKRIETWAAVLVVGAAGGVYDLLTSTFPVASVSVAMAAIYLVLLLGAPAALIMAIVSAWGDPARIASGAAVARSVAAAARGLRWSSVISIACAVACHLAHRPTVGDDRQNCLAPLLSHAHLPHARERDKSAEVAVTHQPKVCDTSADGLLGRVSRTCTASWCRG